MTLQILGLDLGCALIVSQVASHATYAKLIKFLTAFKINTQTQCNVKLILRYFRPSTASKGHSGLCSGKRVLAFG